MRLCLLAAAICSSLSTLGRSLKISPQPQAATNFTSRPLRNKPSSSFQTPAQATQANPNTVTKQVLHSWEDHVCRGEELLKACVSNKDKAVQFLIPIDSPFDSKFDTDLKNWGYNERDADAECMFDTQLKVPFEAMRIDPRGDVEGGPNQCFRFQHWDPDARDEEGYQMPATKQTYKLNGIGYKATQAKAIIGANAEDGAIYLLDVVSALEGAKKAWSVANPPVNELPELRRISDMAWGVWRRVHPGGQGLDNINLFLVSDITNDITKGLIAEALKTYGLEGGQVRAATVPMWPGLTFNMDSEEGAAMLGSPNGIAIGYFLAQHKTQLGGNKYPHIVQIWTENVGGNSYMWFGVDDVPVARKRHARHGKLSRKDNVR